MRRAELEPALRAAPRIVHQRDFLVVGSAATPGSFDDDVLPDAASRSDEADLAPCDDPDGTKSMELGRSVLRQDRDAAAREEPKRVEVPVIEGDDRLCQVAPGKDDVRGVGDADLQLRAAPSAPW